MNANILLPLRLGKQGSTTVSRVRPAKANQCSLGKWMLKRVKRSAKSRTLFADGVPPPSAWRLPQLLPGPRASAAPRGLASVPLHVTEHARHGGHACIKSRQEDHSMQNAVPFLFAPSLLS